MILEEYNFKKVVKEQKVCIELPKDWIGKEVEIIVKPVDLLNLKAIKKELTLLIQDLFWVIESDEPFELMNELQTMDSGTASRILLVLQDINRLIEFEANRIDLGPLIDAAKLTGTEETVVLDCLLSFLREKREHRMLINFPKRFRKANFAKSASKIELIQLERRFHEVNRNVAEKVYCSIQEQLEQAGLKSPSEVLKDFEVRAAPIIVKKAYEITKSVAVSQTP